MIRQTGSGAAELSFVFAEKGKIYLAEGYFENDYGLEKQSKILTCHLKKEIYGAG